MILENILYRFVKAHELYEIETIGLLCIENNPVCKICKIEYFLFLA